MFDREGAPKHDDTRVSQSGFSLHVIDNVEG
jgi:hypothetical protein